MAKESSYRPSAGRIIGKIFGWLFAAVFLIITALAVSGALFVYNKYQEIQPEIDELVDDISASPFEATGPSTIYYWDQDTMDWVLWETLYTEESRSWMSFEQFPDILVDAAVAIEDKSFWYHKGVNWLRTAEATFNYVVRHQAETAGGSTITQQVIKNLTGNWTVSKERKILEILEALSFEKKYSKEQIIELYLNNIYLGSNCYGVYAAAHKYFDKEVKDLDLLECACMVSITNNPSYYDPYRFPEHVKFRAAVVINEMCDQGYISETDELRTLERIGFQVTKDDNGVATFKYDETKDSFVFKDGSPDINIVSESSDHIYSWYVDTVLNKVIEELMVVYDCSLEEANNRLYTGGLKIYTAYDPKIQEKVDEIYHDPDFLVKHTARNTDDPPESAITVIDNATCAVVAMEGGTEEKTESRSFNRAYDMLRQPGSSIKPISVYAPALEEGIITPDTIIQDSPFKKDENGDNWPINAYGAYYGSLSVSYALLYSSNTVAVKVLDMLGLEKSYEWLTQKFRVVSITENDLDHPCLALGGLTQGVSTYEMAGAFAVFARDGIYTEPYFYSQVVDINGNVIIEHGHDEDRILSEETVEEMHRMLNAVANRGTGYNASVNNVICAGKTGTTTNDYDLWFCGYTPNYTAAVWTGYDQNTTVRNEYPNPSAQTWHDVMDSLENGN